MMNHTLLNSPWAKPGNEVLEDLSVNLAQGLSSQEAKKRLKIFGLNALKAEKKITPLQRFLSQFKSPMVIVLLIATLTTAILGEVADSIAIGVILIINAIIAYFQESKAHTAVEALTKLSAPKARVLRDENIFEVESSKICPGDILIFESGDYVPADCRIIQASQLSADEAILTGESFPVIKSVDAVTKDAILVDKKNMLFATTSITTGNAKAVVTFTGMNTEIGRIAELLKIKNIVKTPLQLKLEQVSKKLLIFCGFIVVFIAIFGLFRGEKWSDVLIMSISLAVAAIPEGLPAVVTLALSIAINRMTKKNAIIKHLPSVETLGSVHVICTDKTGTLTTGQMRVRENFLISQGILIESDKKNNVSAHADLNHLIESLVLCSNASISRNGVATGDPTELAFLYLAQKYRIDIKNLKLKYPRLAEWSFDSERKRMSVAVLYDSQVVLHCKGAPESILPLCHLNKIEKNKIQQAIETLSSQGRRILAIATKNLSESQIDFNVTLYKEHSSVENDLIFLGLVAIADPPKKESISAIAECKSAGIRVVMITGDHPMTALAIARELGIVESHTNDPILTGDDINAMSLHDFESSVEKISIYARVTPEHKLKIIQAWQKKGKIVAMTGDGVNDAPALKQASIGIAMGRSGTEVARQASTMILTDDNFSTIVAAVEEGRAIYGNIRRTIQYLLSGNLAEILIMLGAALMGWPVPLAPIHLLWINLVTDGFPALALTTEPVPKNVLTFIKNPSSSTFLDRNFYQEMIFVGMMISIMTLAIYGYILKTEDEVTARTYAFSFLVFAELFRSFSSRSEHKTFFQMGFTSNFYHLFAVMIPILFQIVILYSGFLYGIFKINSISLNSFFLMIAFALIPVTILEIKKRFFNLLVLPSRQ